MITREYVVALINGDYAILEDENKEQISIARALLKDSPVILLDEATASLDAENETQIQEAISKLIKNKTVLIIAHRMRTVTNADKIVVLDNGNVVGIGTHKELLKNCDVYKEIAYSQLSRKELENA